MKGLCSILAFVFLISPNLVIAEHPCNIVLLVDPQILQNIPSNESRMVAVNYVLPNNTKYRLNETGFNLDRRYHSEEETKDFFANTNTTAVKELVINDQKDKLTRMGEYRLYFFVRYLETSSNMLWEARMDIPISFQDVNSKVNFNITSGPIKGLFGEAVIFVEQPDEQKMEYSLHYIIPKTGYNVMISTGYFQTTVDSNNISFPIPQGQRELYPVTLKYTRSGKTGEIRKFALVERQNNVTLNTLESFMKKPSWNLGELVALTHSIVNVAFRPEDFETEIYPIECDSLYCSRQGKCKRIEPFFKKCECAKGFEGVRCTMPQGQSAQVKRMFMEIIKDLTTGEAGKTSVSDTAEIVSQIASAHTLIGYEFIEEVLKLISMLAPQARAKSFVEPLTKSLKSIVNRLDNQAFISKFKYAEKEEYERVGKIEGRFEELLLKIARRMSVQEPMFKQITKFQKRSIKGPSTKDKLVNWLKDMGEKKGHVDEHEIS